MEAKLKKGYALITGASMGLGKAFSIELAKQGFSLILVSLPNQNLQKLGIEISDAFKVEVLCFEYDFSNIKDIYDLTELVNENYQIQVLINNAGTGGSKKFDEAKKEYINTILNVNIHGTSVLTHQLLPNLKQFEKAYILNVSSIAAFSPVGYKTVYPASKSFIYSFSIGLAQELKKDNITVSVISPGAMKTNKEITARIEKQGVIGKLTLLEPTEVAKMSLKKMFKGQTLILVNPMSWFISKLIPLKYKTAMLSNIVKRELEDV